MTSVEPANGTSVQVRIAEAGSPRHRRPPERQVPRRAGLPGRRRRGQPGRRRLRELDGRRRARAHVGDDGRRRLRRPHRRRAASLLGERPARRGGRTAVVVRGGRLPGDGRRRRQRHRCLARPRGGRRRRLRRDARRHLQPRRRRGRARRHRQRDARTRRSRRRPTARVRCCSRCRRATSTTTAGSTGSPPPGPSRSIHADDTSAPFAVSASGFSVARVRAADGDDLAIDLAEPAGFDTGSKPDLTYVGGAAKHPRRRPASSPRSRRGRA